MCSDLSFSPVPFTVFFFFFLSLYLLVPFRKLLFLFSYDLFLLFQLLWDILFSMLTFSSPCCFLFSNFCLMHYVLLRSGRCVSVSLSSAVLHHWGFHHGRVWRVAQISPQVQGAFHRHRLRPLLHCWIVLRHWGTLAYSSNFSLSSPLQNREQICGVSW